MRPASTPCGTAKESSDLKKPEPRHVVHFRMKPEEYVRLKALAKAEDRSVAYVCARTLRQWLGKNPTKETP